MAASPDGVLTGYGFGPARAKDQPQAETFFALRRCPDPGLPGVGAPAGGPCLPDIGLEGPARHAAWRTNYGAWVLCGPGRTSRRPWPKALRRWLARLRRIVETVYEKLHPTFRPLRQRPHTLAGFQARLAAKAALHNFCIWLNDQFGRPRPAFADLIDR